MPDAGPAARRIFVTTPGFENALLAELPSTFTATGTPQEPLGIVQTGEPAAIAATATGREDAGAADPIVDPIFARQQLPAAIEIRAPSVAALADAAYAHIEAAVDRVTGPFTIHAFTPTGAAPSLDSRAALIAAETLGRLRTRRRRAARWYRDPVSASATFGDVELVIQLLVAERDRIWVSAARPRALAGGGWTIAPWPGGVAPVTEDRRPPSRAYRKLEEAFLWMKANPVEHDLCVDLGGAPGGWTYMALARGARVIAVDRAPLGRALLDHPGLTMIVGNAFNYEPLASQAPVDWLLSDVICEPKRAANLIDRWLERGWCRWLVVTVKFKGRSGYGVLADIRATLERRGCARLRIKHLHHNKNEVTVMAAAAA